MTIIKINDKMDEGFKDWLIERDEQMKKDAIIIGSILFVIGIVIFVFLGLG